MTRHYYIEISPRGFANETLVLCGTKAEVEAVSKSYDNNPNAWAIPRPASYPAVRAAKAYAAKWGYDMSPITDDYDGY